MRAIAALGRERELTAGQLARDADVNPASVTAMLDQLEAAGIVARSRSAQDRRVCRVSLTDEGWQLLHRKLDTWETLWREHMAQFTNAEVETATRVLERVAAMLDRLPGARPERTPEAGDPSLTER
jgi:DNA-binding MarR family transcriptional regulator